MASQAGSQAGSLPKDSTASQAGSTHSWEGSSSVASQAGIQATGSTVPPNIPTREGPSHAGNNPPTQTGRQAGRHSTRCRAPQASQGNSATSPASSTGSQEGTQPPTPLIGFPKGLPWKTLTQSVSSTYPANL